MRGEFVVTVDPADRETGVIEKMAAHREGILHRAFSVFRLRRCRADAAAATGAGQVPLRRVNRAGFPESSLRESRRHGWSRLAARVLFFALDRRDIADRGE